MSRIPPKHSFNLAVCKENRQDITEMTIGYSKLQGNKQKTSDNFNL